MNVPFDENSPPPGISFWSVDDPESGYISNLNEPEKIWSDEALNNYRDSIANLRRAHKIPASTKALIDG